MRGGALLIHGLTDSPYSMRHLAEIFRRQGFYVLCLRMQGHGTVPAGLTAASWQDWLAAVRMGARHVRARAGGGKPFVLVGYSNGGGLAVKYALDALDSAALPRPGRLILLSPMIGVTPLARFSTLQGVLGGIPGFEKAGWVDVLPEYNPFKYTSFPAHAGRQIFELTSALQEQVRRASETGRIAGLAPILTFQSLADDTVSTRAVAEKLYDRLPANGSELVLFDVNRQAYLRPFLLPGLDAWLAARLKGPPRSYGFSLVTNAGTATSEVVARSFAAVTGAASTRPLGLSWPPQMYSLSHVAIPFPVTDPLYGLAPDPREFFGARLGTLTPRGERSLLSVSHPAIDAGDLRSVLPLSREPGAGVARRRWSLRGRKAETRTIKDTKDIKDEEAPVSVASVVPYSSCHRRSYAKARASRTSPLSRPSTLST